MASPQKEWRAVPEHQSVRKAVDEELGISDGDYLQQKLHNISRQKEELQQMEIALRAQMIARSEIASMQNNFESQLKEHADAVSKLQDQLHDKEKVIYEVEKKMEEKDRELLAMKRDNEAAWAKEDLLREQKKELATFRRELDHSEAERLQHIKQLHDLQEHLQDKERQLREMQDQHRVAQETIIYKDEQLREAQAWITRTQEMDALQSQSLQAELRERTEQCQQLWLGWQRQIMEVERFHLHTIQQLQLELADARERSGSSTNEPGEKQVTSEASQFRQSDVDVSNAVGYTANSGAISNGNVGKSSIAPNSSMIDHVAAVPLASSALLGLAAYIPPGQVTPVHPFVLHQQGPQLPPSFLPNAPISYYQPQPVSAFQELQKAQAASEGLQISAHSAVPQNSVSSDMQFGYQSAVNEQAPQREYLDGVRIPSSAGEAEVVQSIERNNLVSSKPEQSSEPLSSQSHNSSSLDKNQQNNESTELSSLSLNGHEVGSEGLAADKSASAVDSSSLFRSGNKETPTKRSVGTFLPEPIISHGQSNTLNTATTAEINLLDERSLLACIVRTIPGGGKIRISSTLPNRLGKMLAPLHWHDYKKKYGKLDDFVGNHPELFVVEGDFIQLREGAQEMIAAKAAVAKVAAAAVASSSSSHSSNLPSVAVTPLAQTYRPKGIPLTDGKNQHPNGVLHLGNSSMKILSKDNVGASFDRSSSSSIQIKKGTANGTPISGFVGKPSGRSKGSTSASRR